MTAKTDHDNTFTVNLDNCDREPIHIPGLVQSHGVLLVISEPDLRIKRISENCAGHFGRTADKLLGRPLATLLPADYLEYLERDVLPCDLEASPAYLNPLTLNDRDFEAIIHRFRNELLLEFEHPPPDLVFRSGGNAYHDLRQQLNEISRTGSVGEFCRKTAEAVRAFTGFDRVMIYRFHEDDSGEVIAEARREDLEPFLGLHYPASDIPKQARELYLKQVLRFKFDVAEAPAEIIPPAGSGGVEPVDLSHAALREMSPIHIEYLQNMDVAASMSVSIVRDGRLWGLIACHHTSPCYVPHAARMNCEFLAHTVSLQIEAKSNTENYEEIARLNEAHGRIIGELTGNPDLPSTLIQGAAADLLSTIEAGGAGLIFEDRIYLTGETPAEPEVKKIVEWLWKNQDREVFQTDRLAHHLPLAEGFCREASGLLAVRLTRESPEYIIWFRPEYVRQVRWGGNPEKAVVGGKYGERLQPRKSFAAWQQEVRGRSQPWRDFEVEFARRLRLSIVEVFLARLTELRDLNNELETSNTELDSFAFVASHDLKEPLRGIHHYSNFLIEDYGERLDPEGVERLQTLIRLSGRMEDLLDSLLYYSQVGRLDLRKTDIDLQRVLDETLEFLRPRIEENRVEIRVPRPLPTALADEIRVGEVFSNLISNAIKYSDRAERVVEIGYLENILHNIADEPRTEQLYYVRDNGIGIDRQHHADIFMIFKRLHGRSEYGGGSGAGLTIVKKIIERHGGRIWLESTPGAGTTFYFTLG